MTEGRLEESVHAPKNRRGGRHLAREMALQALYQCDITGDDITQAVLQLGEVADPQERADLVYFRQLAVETWRHRQTLDPWIARLTENWALDRVSVVERNILRLGVYELLHQRDIPERVVINEAIELAKRYGGESSHRFVNGIMDQVAARLREREQNR